MELLGVRVPDPLSSAGRLARGIAGLALTPLDWLPGVPQRRAVWSCPGRLYVETHGVHGPGGERVSRRIERALNGHPGVPWARVNAPSARVTPKNHRGPRAQLELHDRRSGLAPTRTGTRAASSLRTTAGGQSCRNPRRLTQPLANLRRFLGAADPTTRRHATQATQRCSRVTETLATSNSAPQMPLLSPTAEWRWQLSAVANARCAPDLLHVN